MGVLAADIERGAGGKDSVQMGADGDAARLLLPFPGLCIRGRRGVRADGQQIANGIGGDGETQRLEPLTQPRGALLLGKGRRRHGADAELNSGDLLLMPGKPVQKPVNARIGE